MSIGEALRPRLDQVEKQALIAGGVGLAVCAVAALTVPSAFFPAYLVGYLFWVGIALGCISITMLHHLVGGTWGLIVRRPLEAGALMLWPLTFLALPFAFGLKALYPWSRPEVYLHDEAVKTKLAYLNPAAFGIRAVIYFLIWNLFAILLTRWSAEQDQTALPGPTRRLQLLSGPGLVVCFLTGTFASIDWVMSLEPDWYSTIYGAMVITGFGLATFAAVIFAAALLSEFNPVARLASPTQFQDLGNLMLAFVMLWAYMSFSQYLIIWSGNLIEEIPWYLRRTQGGWQWEALALVLFQFFMPFTFLLFRDNKRAPRVLAAIALAVIFMHLVDLTWLVLPAQARGQPSSHVAFPWLALALVAATTVGIGGICVATFIRLLKVKPLVPLNDAEINPAEEHES
jgi:hypothetical protein